jgi:hypothetical protein
MDSIRCARRQILYYIQKSQPIKQLVLQKQPACTAKLITLEVTNLIDPLRMVNKRISVMLPISVNIIISIPLVLVHGVILVPTPENVFHPGFDVTPVHRSGITAGPVLEICS